MMLKKRLIGVVTIKNGQVVHSFGYKKYLPIGKSGVIVKNLDRWGVDEIILQCIDRASYKLGPDFETLNKISHIGISTPIVYCGGIRNADDAAKVVSNGADRIMVDNLLYSSPNELEMIADRLGVQAIIANIPIRQQAANFLAFKYKEKTEIELNKFINKIPLKWISEILITDWCNEGIKDSFDLKLLKVADIFDKPLICFGGISTSVQINKILACKNIVGVGIGNFLNYQEHAVQKLKLNISHNIIRPPYFHIEEN